VTKGAIVGWTIAGTLVAVWFVITHWRKALGGNVAPTPIGIDALTPKGALLTPTGQIGIPGGNLPGYYTNNSGIK
jgi:hypothetical protein